VKKFENKKNKKMNGSELKTEKITLQIVYVHQKTGCVLENQKPLLE